MMLITPLALRHPDSQRGVALVVSLVLLVAMSLVAVSTLSGSRLNERVAANAQQKAIAFEVAESALEAGFDKDQLKIAINSIPSDQIDGPAAQRLSAFDTGLRTSYDQSRTSRAATDRVSVDIDGRVTIQYCGETARTYGSDLSLGGSTTPLVGMLFDVNGVAEIGTRVDVDGVAKPGSSATRADHVQRGLLLVAKTGRRGTCVTRGVAS